MTQKYWFRYIIVGRLPGVAIGVIIQMVRIQNIPGASDIMAMSEYYMGYTTTVYPDRGEIYDRWGRLLAGNETTYEVGLDLVNINDPETIASVASSVLQLDYMETLAYAQIKAGTEGRYYIVLDDFVSKDQIEQLEIINEDYQNREVKRNQKRPSLSGLVWSAHTKRSYPEGDLASNLIGFYSFLDAPKRGFLA